ncbi:hypothetical protein ACWGIU_27710 [Streptomyces sp. NPDC054840]
MNGTARTLQALHHGESHLAGELLAAAERHRDEHEVHHVATDLAHWSEEHVRRLSETAEHYGVEVSDASENGVVLAPKPSTGDDAFLSAAGDSGLLLLADLRDLHLAAVRNSLYWEMLAQTAQAARDERLLALASACHPRTLRQMRWTNTMIKNLCPQVLTST